MAASARTSPTPNPNNPVQTVRRFNRFYTRQIGVLQEHLLHSRFSLTEVRVLYELAHRSSVTAGELCQELGLDRGYLSRMLQSFEKKGWIKTTTSPADRRRIFLSLTGKGRKVFAPLDGFRLRHGWKPCPFNTPRRTPQPGRARVLLVPVTVPFH